MWFTVRELVSLKHESVSCALIPGPPNTWFPKGISISVRTLLWRRQCWTTMTHILWTCQTFSPLSGMPENVRPESAQIPQTCFFNTMTDWLQVESAFESQVPMSTTVLLQSHPCDTLHVRLVRDLCIHVHREHSAATHFKCLHTQATVIYSKGPLHIWWCMTVFQLYSCWLCVGDCRLDGGLCACVCLCVAERRWSRIRGQGGVTVWNCYRQADGGGCRSGVRVQRTEANKEWRFWLWLNGSCTGNSSVLIRKRICRFRLGTERRRDGRQTHRLDVQCKWWHYIWIMSLWRDNRTELFFREWMNEFFSFSKSLFNS